MFMLVYKADPIGKSRLLGMSQFVLDVSAISHGVPTPYHCRGNTPSVATPWPSADLDLIDDSLSVGCSSGTENRDLFSVIDFSQWQQANE
jgi:hypothetical protein